MRKAPINFIGAFLIRLPTQRKHNQASRKLSYCKYTNTHIYVLANILYVFYFIFNY